MILAGLLTAGMSWWNLHLARSPKAADEWRDARQTVGWIVAFASAALVAGGLFIMLFDLLNL